MGTVGDTHDGIGAGNRCRPRVLADILVSHDFFHLDNGLVRGALHEQVYPARSANVLDIAIRIGNGRVQEGHVGLDRWDGQQGFVPNRVAEDLEVRVDFGQGSPDATAPRQEGQALSRRLEARGQNTFFTFPDLDFTALGGPAKGRGDRYSKTAAGVITDDFSDATGGNEHVQRQADIDNRQVFQAAPDELMHKGHRGRGADGHRHAVFDPAGRFHFINNMRGA